MFHCRVMYEDPLFAPLLGRQEIEENVGIYLDDNYEQISVPVPDFGSSDPADIIHDFHRVRIFPRCEVKFCPFSSSTVSSSSLAAQKMLLVITAPPDGL